MDLLAGHPSRPTRRTTRRAAKKKKAKKARCSTTNIRVVFFSVFLFVFTCAGLGLYSMGELTTDHRGHTHNLGRIHAIVETTETVSTHSASPAEALAVAHDSRYNRRVTDDSTSQSPSTSMPETALSSSPAGAQVPAQSPPPVLPSPPPPLPAKKNELRPPEPPEKSILPGPPPPLPAEKNELRPPQPPKISEPPKTFEPPKITTTKSKARVRPGPTPPPEWEQTCASSGGDVTHTPHSGFFRNVAPQEVTDVAPDIPIPVVIITGGRHMYLRKVVESLRHADSFGDSPASSGIRTCIFIKDRTHWARQGNKNLDDSVHSMIDDILRSAGEFCDVRVLNHEEDGTSVRGSWKNQITLGWHLVNHWVWAQQQVWALDRSGGTLAPGYVESVAGTNGGRLDVSMTRALMAKYGKKSLPSLQGYDGDILFLEDDSIVSPDIFACLNFMSQIKALGTHSSGTGGGRPIEAPYAIGLGGWNAENMWGPHPLDFRVLVSVGLPTLGYAHNRSFYEDFIAHANPPIDKPPKGVDIDWTSAILQLVDKNPEGNHAGADTGGHDHPRYGHVPVLRPSLSRVWHIGTKSSVGNSHGAHIKGCPPWSGIPKASLMMTNAAPRVTELTFTEIIREKIVTVEKITKEEAARRKTAARSSKQIIPGKFVNGRPFVCTQCKAGGADDGGMPIDVEDYSCHHFCSRHGFCGVGETYEQDGVDCGVNPTPSSSPAYASVSFGDIDKKFVEVEKITTKAMPKTVKTKRLTRGRLHAALTDVVGLPCRAVDLVGKSESDWGYYAHWQQLIFDSGLDLTGGVDRNKGGKLSFLSNPDTRNALWRGIFESMWLPEEDPRNWNDRGKRSLTDVSTSPGGNTNCRQYPRGEIVWAARSNPKGCNAPLGMNNAMEKDLWPQSARSRRAQRQGARDLINEMLSRRLRAVCGCPTLMNYFDETVITMRHLRQICEKRGGPWW